MNREKILKDVPDSQNTHSLNETDAEIELTLNLT
jgi:hypothetical protein